jgi:hypothetical protein
VIKADGKDVELNTLSSEDPRYLSYRDELLFAGQVMSTQGYAKNQGIIVQAQLQADQAQRKRYNTNMAGMVTGQATVNRQSIARDYVALWQKPGGNTEAAAGSHYGFVGNAMQQQIDQIRLLGLPEEAKTKLINDYLEGFASDVVAAIKFKGVFTEDLNILLKPALRSVMTGPVDQRIKADGTPNQALRLFNTLGGEAYLDKVVAKANAAQIQDNTQQSQMAGIQEQQAYDARLSAALPEGRRSDPAAIKSFFQAERERAAAEPDGIQRAARFAQIDASERQLTETYVKPVQEQRALWYAQQLGQTVNDEAARNRVSAQLQADLAAGIVTSATATSFQTSLSAQASKEVRTYDKDINKRIDTLSKEWVTYSGSPNSYGGSAVVGFESQALYKFRDEARRRSYDVVYQAIKDGKDPVQALNQLWTNSNFGLRRREEVGGTQAPMYENGAQLIQKNTGNWARSFIPLGLANQLKGQAQVRPLYDPEAFATDVDEYLKGNASQNFKTLLRAVGGRPSTLILKQLQLHGVSVDEKTKARILEADAMARFNYQRVSAAPRRQSPQQNQALAGIQIVGGALGNLLVPPAQASPAADMSMFYADPGAKPRPKPAAPKVTVTPQARIDGYMKRLAYIETRIRNIPNAEGSAGRGYFQAFPDFSKEAIAASGGIDPRDSNYNRSAKASAAWIRVYNKKAWAAIQAGRYDEADRLLRNTWPSLPGGSQAQDDKVQKEARKYLR